MHFNTYTGLPCSCGWGERKQRRTASQNVRKIRNQDQKAFRTEEGQKYLEALESHIADHPQAEAMVPWLASRYKHGDISVKDRLLAPDDVRPHLYWDTTTRGGGRRPINRVLPEWSQWMEARQHPLRRGVNIMELSPQEVNEKAAALREDIQSKKKVENWKKDWGDTGSRVHTFDPRGHDDTGYGIALLENHKGWGVHQLENANDAEAESAALGHCIGRDDQPYKRAIEEGRIEAYSLRDPQGYPHVTWHFNPDGTLAHVQGQSGEIKPQYRNLISHWHDLAGKEDYESGEDNIEGYDEHVQLPDPTTVEEYRDQYHPDDSNYYEWAHEYAENGIGETTDIEQGAPDWEAIHGDLENSTPQERHEFYHTVANNYHHHGWDKEVQANAGFMPTPHDLQVQQEWNAAYERMHNPQTGQFQSPSLSWSTGIGSKWLTAWDAQNTPMLRERRPSVLQTNPDPWEYVQPQPNNDGRATYAAVAGQPGCPHCLEPGLQYDEGEGLYNCPSCSGQADHLDSLPSVTQHPNGVKVVQRSAVNPLHNMYQVAWRRPFIHYPEINTTILGDPGDVHNGIKHPRHDWLDGHDGYVSTGDSDYGEGFGGTEIPPPGMGWFDSPISRKSGELPAYHPQVQEALSAVEPHAAQTHQGLRTDEDEDDDWSDGPSDSAEPRYILGGLSLYDWRADRPEQDIAPLTFEESFRVALAQLSPVEVVDARLDPMNEANIMKYRGNDFTKRRPVVYNENENKAWVGGPKYYHYDIETGFPESTTGGPQATHHGYVWTHNNTMDWHSEPPADHDNIRKSVGDFLGMPLGRTNPADYDDDDFWDE